MCRWQASRCGEGEPLGLADAESPAVAFRVASPVGAAAYCTAALERHPDDPGTAAWVEWALAHAEHLDPLAAPPAPPELREPSLDELRPFLPGRNPFEFSW